MVCYLINPFAAEKYRGSSNRFLQHDRDFPNMKMNKVINPLAQSILDLTLEIIYLLTGEDHLVVKIHKMDNIAHQMSGGYCRNHSPSMEPPLHKLIRERHNEQKILELSNQIIRLLTGEVPIRCEDVTVYLSMEEWEYVERHKDLYKDVMMEDHQPVTTPDKSESGDFHLPYTLSDFGTESVTSNEGECREIKKATNEPLADEERYIPEEDTYPTIEGSPMVYPLLIIKEEPSSCEEGNLSDRDLYKPQEHTQTEYPSTDTMEESPTYGEGNLTDTDMYEPPEHTQTECPPGRFDEYLKSRISSSESLTKSRKPDRCNDHHKANVSPAIIINTDLVTHNSTYTENSELSFEMGKVSCSEPDLVINERDSRDDEPFSPPACGESLNSESVLEDQHGHNEKQPFPYPEWEEHFTDRNTLERHQRIHTGKIEFKCSECGRCFTTASGLSTHETIHTGKNQFKCIECGKCFPWASSLARHKKTHTGHKPFRCHECGKCFSTKDKFIRHQQAHTGEKPFKCAECGKCFSQATNLARHKVIHTVGRLFKCQECGKCFTQALSLANHNRIHTGENPFRCLDCGKCFNQASSLANHKRSHTGGKKT
uniref:C2H2-type domain-containing protein n=1 Tax=Leptobrachium leishanense TaxID=445787 RepID=A0A8C5MC67_9ANUR